MIPPETTARESPDEIGAAIASEWGEGVERMDHADIAKVAAEGARRARGGARESPEVKLEATELLKLCDKATPGPWAFEGTSEKSNDYMVGVVCPVDDKGNPGPQISGHVPEHPHYYNEETRTFGEWYCEGVAQIDEGYHGADASCYDDAAFIAAARTAVPVLLAEVARLKAELAEAQERVLEYQGIVEASPAVQKAMGHYYDKLREVREATARAEERAACAKIAFVPSKPSGDPDGRTRLPSKREEVGHLVREAWIAWAKQQPNPKPHWLLPYSQLSPEDCEADCQIGEAISNHIAAAIRARSAP